MSDRSPTRAVFVHGNPETAAIWRPLLGELGYTDAMTLSPPGFGAPVPDGFGATADEYAAWLASELEELSAPIDLVGHDWGGGHVMRVAMARPDLIRSWAMDIAGCFAPDYVWHDMAQVWQSPGAGEETVAGMASPPVADRAALFESLGMTPDIAHDVAEATDNAMGRCILSLYRSAAQPAMARLGERCPPPRHARVSCSSRPRTSTPAARRAPGGQPGRQGRSGRAPRARALVDDPGSGRRRDGVAGVLALADRS